MNMNQQSDTVDDLLEQLTTAKIKLWSDGGELRYRAPKGTLNPSLKQKIKEHKAEILRSLTPANSATQLNLTGFFAQPTLAQLQEVVQDSTPVQRSSFMGERATTIELATEAEAILDWKISSDLERSPEQPSAIFLTGATGFLGVYLLYELLVQTQADIYCLVRVANLASASQRLQQKLQDYHLWQDDFLERIMPLVGDLAQPNLGLSLSQYEQLCQAIDVIYHGGASVNFVYPYSALKAPNVLGTKEVLKIASTSRIKPVHYISTIGVFLSADDDDKIIYETDSIDTGATLEGGYAQSKWVAEKLVSLVGQKGLPITIYRPGAITGHSTTGISGTQDWLSLILKSCLETEIIPEVNAQLSFTPVDYVSRAIVCLSRQQNINHLKQNHYHLVSPHFHPWNGLADLIQSLGYPIRPVSFEQWCEELERTDDGNSAVDSLKPLLSFIKIHANSNNIRFNAENAIREIAQQGLEYPDSIQQLLDRQLAYFSQSKD